MKFLDFLNESTKSISVSTKDWERMIDVILKGKSFDGVIKTIKDKNKAAARFIAVQKLKDENDSSEKSFENSEYSGFYKKSIDLNIYNSSSDNYLKNLVIDNITFEKSFDKDTLEYIGEVDYEIDKINIKTELSDSKSKISGDGEQNLEVGEKWW